MEAIEILRGGLNGLAEYLSLHVISCLVPALFIAGAISAFASQAAILKYFGPQAKKPIAYSVGSVSGAILAVCSCTVLPLFGGIYKRGAGLGPAIAFLFSGPAINILAIVYTANILGYQLGIARAVAAIAFAVCIGLIMAFIFRKEEVQKAQDQAFAPVEADTDKKKPWQYGIFFGSLLGILITAAGKNWIPFAILCVVLGFSMWRWFTGDEIKEWMQETLYFLKRILPWLLIGVFIAGILGVVIPPTAMAAYMGGNTIFANFIASIGGALMYIATLTEVPIIKTFLDLGMGKGPALALLLAGPALSLPSMLALRGIMGTKKMLTYVALVVAAATITGLIYGSIA
ncbi:MAG: permease [Dehalococcoidales bacterium]|nr:permease [Dehalococcoidales bacterium]